MKQQVTDTLRTVFRPEFLNRIDEIIVFHALGEDDLARIVELLLGDLARRLAEHDLALEVTPAARRLIVTEGHDPAYGARPLRRAIQRLVENPLARVAARGPLQAGHADQGRRGSGQRHAAVHRRRRDGRHDDQPKSGATLRSAPDGDGHRPSLRRATARD